MLDELDTFQNRPQALFSRIISVPALYQAWRKVRANRGAAGVDAMSLEAFELRLEVNLKELSRSLLSKAYQPMPARYVNIAKANGKERELAILTVRDRVAQRATLDVIEPLFEPQFLDCNFAFRPDRSVEMAIQRMIAARANGYWWTVESDVEDFFGSIDRRLLLNELEQTVRDAEILRLINLWLEAGALDPRPTVMNHGSWRRGKEAVARLRLLLRETVNQSLDDYIANRLGTAPAGSEDGSLDPSLEVDGDRFAGSSSAASLREALRKEARREGVKRLLQDGALLAVSERALIAKLLGMKVLGAGGLALTAALLAPKAVGAYRNYFHPRQGTLQGAPISPLLTNVYMTPFDRALTERGWRLVRYCDDLVIQCRTEEEAQDALSVAREALGNRRLRMHADKTRIVRPDEEFEFLGYVFAADGSVIPPPTVPDLVARQIRAMARRAARWRKISDLKSQIMLTRRKPELTESDH